MSHEINIATFSEFEASVQPPEWIELVPIGKKITTVDGREFVNDDPEAVLEHFEKANRKPPIDLEHRFELKKEGEVVPALGWIEELSIRNNSIWGRVEWTGGEHWVKYKSFRYISPGLKIKKGGKKVVGISSVALTNDPALHLKALFSKEKGNEKIQPKAKETVMDLTALCNALGLKPEANESSMIAAVEEIKGERDKALASSQKPDPEKFVPIETFNKLKKDKEDLETEIASNQEAAVKERAEELLDDAVKAGKIAPADKDFYSDMCSTEEGCDKFEKFIASKKAIISTNENLSAKSADESSDTLDDNETSILNQLGVEPELYAAVKNGKKISEVEKGQGE